MLKYALITGLSLLAMAAFADPVEYTIIVSPQDIAILGTALSPQVKTCTDIQAVISRLQAQIARQNVLPPPEPPK